MKKFFTFLVLLFANFPAKTFASSIVLSDEKILSPAKIEVFFDLGENSSISQNLFFENITSSNFYLFSTFSNIFSSAETTSFNDFEEKIADKSSKNINQFLKNLPTGFSIDSDKKSKKVFPELSLVIENEESLQKFFNDERIVKDNLIKLLQSKLKNNQKILVQKFVTPQNSKLLEIFNLTFENEQSLNFDLEKFSDNLNKKTNFEIILSTPVFVKTDSEFLNLEFSDKFSSSSNYSTNEVWIQKFSGSNYLDESEDLWFYSGEEKFVGTGKITKEEILKLPKTLFNVFLKNFYVQMAVFFIMIFWQSKVKRPILKLFGWILQAPFMFFSISISFPKIFDLFSNLNSENFASELFSITPYTFLVSVIFLVIIYQIIMQFSVNKFVKKQKEKKDSKSVIFVDETESFSENFKKDLVESLEEESENENMEEENEEILDKKLIEKQKKKDFKNKNSSSKNLEKNSKKVLSNEKEILKKEGENKILKENSKSKQVKKETKKPETEKNSTKKVRKNKKD